MQQPTDIFGVIFWLAGGLGLFIYGIEMMGLALRRAAGFSLRKQINRCTQTPLRGLAAGTVITGLVQSSSATTVMVVGFIQAGLISFPQSVGLIFGANIGTTVTPQIAAIKLDALALPMIGIGFLINLFARKRPWLDIGKGIMGFGMLFFGLMIMKLAVGNYHDLIRSWLEAMSGQGTRGWLLMFGATLMLTAVIQSSAAMVVMIQALAFGGVIGDISLAIPMILGAHIGTCVTAILATLKANVSARRAAVAHVTFNVIGSLVTVMLLSFYVWLIPKTAADLPHQIANCHTLIKIVNVALLLPLVQPFTALVERLVPAGDSVEIHPQFLDVNDLQDPGSALANARRETARMGTIGTGMVEEAMKGFLAKDELRLEAVVQREEALDILYHAVADYVRRTAHHNLPADLSPQPAFIVNLLSNMERIGDHAENIAELGQLYSRDPGVFGDGHIAELKVLMALVDEMGVKTVRQLEDPAPERREAVAECRARFKRMRVQALTNNQQRMAAGDSNAITGMIFAQLIDHLTSVIGHFNRISRAVHEQA